MTTDEDFWREYMRFHLSQPRQAEGKPDDDPTEIEVDATPTNWDTFWREVARLHRMYGTLEDEEGAS